MSKDVLLGRKYIAWFSCGAPSTVAAMLAIREFGKENVRVIRQDTGSEHPDNERYMRDVEKWLGIRVEITKSEKYVDVDDVIEKTRWIVGVGGARCTGELKRVPAEECINWGKNQEIEMFGYTIEEQHRINRWVKNNPERRINPILIRHGLSKDDCLGIIDRAGIEIPAMYRLGYNNNNCLGCVKGGAGYWNKIRIDFPEVFERRAKQERDIGATICKVSTGRKSTDVDFKWEPWVQDLSTFKDMKVSEDGLTGRMKLYLDELPENVGNHKHEPAISCGLFCMLASE